MSRFWFWHILTKTIYKLMFIIFGTYMYTVLVVSVLYGYVSIKNVGIF